MKSPFGKTYLALGLLLALGVYYFLAEAGRPPVDDREKKPRVLTLDKSKVKEVEIAPKDGETIRLAKDAGSWRLTAPLSVAADGTEVEGLVSTLEGLEVESVVSQDGAGLANYGLEPPGLSVSIQQEGAGAPLRLLVGDEVPAASERYAKLATEPRVFTIPGHVGSALDKKPFDLRDRKALRVDRDDVRSIEVKGPEGDYALVKDDKGLELVEPALRLLREASWANLPGSSEDWVFTRPLATLAARWSVDGLLGSIESLRFESVAAEEAKDLKPFGLDKPARRVVLGLADGSTKTLEIGGSTSEKKHYARDATQTVVGVIPGALVDDLAKGMDGLRAKRLLELRVYDVVEFDVEAGGAKKSFARSGTAEGPDGHQWKRTSPDPKELETRRVEDALFSLGGVDVTEFVDRPAGPEAYGLATPALKVTLRLGPGRGTASFELGRKDTAVHARRSGDAAVLKVDPAQADKVIKAFQEMESPPPSPSPGPASPSPSP